MSEPLLSLDAFRQAWVGIDHAEGVAVAADGTAWASGAGGQVYRGRLDDVPAVIATLPAQTLGVTLDGRGDAYVTTYDEAGDAQALNLVRPDGTWRPVSTGADGRSAVAPNFSVVLPSGVIVYSDSGDFGGGNGRIVAVDETASRIVNETARAFPNGLALASDGTTLAVAESTLPGISLFDVAADGALSGRRVLAELPPGTVPDGLAYDVTGRLLVACYEPNALYVIEPGGETTLLGLDPDGTRLANPTNLAFLPGTRTVVVANLGGEFLSVFEHDAEGLASEPPPARVGMI